MAKEFDTWATEIQKAIDNPDDAAIVVSTLTASRDDYRDTYSELTAAQEEIERLKADNVRLTDTNRELFLRIGQTLSQTSVGQERGGEAKTRAETITPEDLFKEDS